jgi:hypothetical protein
MCRNIKRLRQPEGKATEEEVKLAALQFVRKVSGYRKPSKANEEVFDQAVTAAAAATQQLLDNLVIR